MVPRQSRYLHQHCGSALLDACVVFRVLALIGASHDGVHELVKHDVRCNDHLCVCLLLCESKTYVYRTSGDGQARRVAG